MRQSDDEKGEIKMGCDIHLFAETKRYRHDDERRENGVWISADKWSVNEEKALYQVNSTIDNNWHFHVADDDKVYKGRNYDLFAILAGVRNYNKLTPISYPKGLPDDVCMAIKKEHDCWEDNAHSQSYVTLKELLAYDWKKEMLFMAKARTKEQAIHIFGDKIVETHDTTTGVNVHYLTTLAERTGNFMETIEKLKALQQYSNNLYHQVNEEDIRIVFWFDS
ncbi:hypothetical protein [Listeria monocytogenes]|uniref:hypothetical protein n=2 Tax=Listeria monocytogenes TaxID=1639 RepID=UPI0011EA5F1E|nr:hypothetical protein [Listeria monocytogenes]EAG1729779.1 hypothetical protein [Listeria monocytogenes]EDK0031862.1 hypothetical protein [Listeria monocytogenes]EDN8611043.1 hypothetical protein [Listeria monocytogenes]EDN9775549.1 hypothetical protein [Listeria monocytogenes]